MAPVKSSPSKKGPKSSKPTSSKQHDSPVHESEPYFTIKTNKGKSKESYPVSSVHISPIKFKEWLKRSYHASDFIPETEISPSRSQRENYKVKKVHKSIIYIFMAKEKHLWLWFVHHLSSQNFNWTSHQFLQLNQRHSVCFVLYMEYYEEQ